LLSRQFGTFQSRFDLALIAQGFDLGGDVIALVGDERSRTRTGSSSWATWLAF
jgi:hypothetical protein